MAAFEQVSALLIELSEEQVISQLMLLSTCFPLLFSSALKAADNKDAFMASFPLYNHAMQLIRQAFTQKNWKSSLPLSLALLRFTQVLLLAVSLHEDEDGMDLETDLLQESPLKLGISCIPAKETLQQAFRDDANFLFRELLKMLRDLPSPAWTAWLNLLQPICQYRPAFLSTLIPSLLDLLEPKSILMQGDSSPFSAPQRRNILHCLKASLSVLLSVPKAEKFTPLLLEAVDKCSEVEGTLITGSAVVKGRKKVTPSTTATTEAPIDEEEERELAASLGGIENRISARGSGAFAQQSDTQPGEPIKIASSNLQYETLASEVLLRELIKIPHPLVVEMVVRMLGTWTAEQIKATLENRWPRRADSSVSVSKSTEQAFQLQAEPLTPELPGEIIHLSVSRILQTLSDLTEYHLSGRRDDLIVPLSPGSSTKVATKGIPVPLVRTCRLVALIAAHVGSVKSDALMDPEKRLKKRQEKTLDPRFRQTQPNKDDEDDDDDEEDEKTVNQIILSWINEDLAMRFDFVWWWLEAVWIREGKEGKLVNEDECEYDQLFDNVVALAGEFFCGETPNANADAEVLARVLDVFLLLPRLNASFIRNLIYPLLEAEERFRATVLDVLATLILNRPAMRSSLSDLVMTLTQSDDAGLRHATIDSLLLKRRLYPALKSLSSQLESYSLESLDSLINTAKSKKEPSLKRLKLDSATNLNEKPATKADIFGSDSEDEADNQDEADEEESTDFQAETDLFLGLLKRGPERLLKALLIRFPKFSPKLQEFMLKEAVPSLVAAWSVSELRAAKSVLLDSGRDELTFKLVSGILKASMLRIKSTETPDADVVEFYESFAQATAEKIAQGSWSGQLVADLLFWLLRDQSDLPAFAETFLPRLILDGGFSLSVAERICSGELINPTQLLVQLHFLPSAIVPLKAQIEAIQMPFQAAQSNNQLFTPAVISAALSQLCESPSLSPLLGRTLLQSVPLASASQSPLNPQFLCSLLSKLIGRRVWENARLWEGWIRGVRALLPGSLSVLLQLPPAELERLIGGEGGGADLRGPLKEYLYNQPPSVRNRYMSILKSLERQ